MGRGSNGGQRVLVVIQGAAYGGAHNQVVRLVSRLQGRGFHTDVLMTDEAGNAAERFRHEGVAVRLDRMRRIRARKPLETVAYVVTFWRQVTRIRRHITATDASIVQVHGISNIDVAVAGWLAGTAVVWQILDTRAPRLLRMLFSPAVVRLADAVLVTGTSILGEYPGLRPVSERTFPYFPPVSQQSLAELERARERGRKALGLSDDEVAVGSLANFNPQKGHHHLIEAFADSQSLTSAPKARLFVRGGDAPGHDRYRRRLAWLASQRGLPAEAVASLSPELSSGDFVAALDVFCLSAVGRSEGTPTVVIEAMQARVPVVVTHVGGVVDLLQNEVHGLIVPVGDRKALSCALNDLVSDEKRRRSFGEAARQRAEARLSIDACEGAYAQAYESALSHRDLRLARRGSSRRAYQRET